MKHVRFYLEYDSPQHKRRGEHSGNVLAVYPEQMNSCGHFDAIGAVYGDVPNSSVTGTTAHYGYLQVNCKRINEQEARRIHPRLFAMLDAGTKTQYAVIENGVATWVGLRHHRAMMVFRERGERVLCHAYGVDGRKYGTFDITPNASTA